MSWSRRSSKMSITVWCTRRCEDRFRTWKYQKQTTSTVIKFNLNLPLSRQILIWDHLCKGWEIGSKSKARRRNSFGNPFCRMAPLLLIYRGRLQDIGTSMRKVRMGATREDQQTRSKCFLRNSWLDNRKRSRSRHRCGICHKFRHRNNRHIELKTSRRSWIDLLSTRKLNVHIVAENSATKLRKGTFQFVLRKRRLLM